MSRENMVYEGKRTLACIVASLMYAIGVNLFVVPAQLYSGGLMGICQVIRTLLVEYLPRYSEEQHHRHDVRPGLTGLAQVSGRNLLSWEEKFKLDVDYVARASLLLDIKIVFLTAVIVLRRKGISSAGSATQEEFRGVEELIDAK